jgi:type IV/VI secretion system ImpK/VasF family protein
MRQEIADIVFPVFSHALRVRERLENGEALDMVAEQATLRGLLKTAAEAQRWPDYGGDGERYLGIRYALTCWLDEVFILDSPWGQQWNENALEVSLYQTERQRAWRFWAQAKMAQARSAVDALEVFYLCMMLGFRGDGPEPPETLAAWREAAEAQISRGQGQTWPGPQELKPEGDSLPRRGRERLRRAALALVAVAAVLIPTATFVLFDLFR